MGVLNSYQNDGLKMKYFEKLELINADLDRLFPNGRDPFQMMTRLLEEAGELAEQVHIFEGSGAKPKKHSKPNPKKMAKEIQDVIGCALQVAQHYDIMPEVKEAIEQRFARRLLAGRFTADELRTVNDWPPRNVNCVGVVVLRDEKVLLVKQAAGTSLAGQWSVPWGVVDENEFPNSAAVRETAEEAGLKVMVDGLIGVQHIGWENAISLIYLCTLVEGVPTPDGIETDAAEFFSLAELNLIEEPIEKWTEWIARRVLQGDFQLIRNIDENPFKPLSSFF